MSLLYQTIREYLKECHPKWKATSPRLSYTIYITNTDQYIRVVTNMQRISYSPYGPHQNYTPYRVQYTEATILPLITEAINYIEQL